MEIKQSDHLIWVMLRKVRLYLIALKKTMKKEAEGETHLLEMATALLQVLPTEGTINH